MPSPLTLPVRYTRHQPPLGTPIRAASPLAQAGGLVWCVAPGAGDATERVSRRPGTLRGAVTARAATALGGGAHNPGDGANGITYPLVASDPLTTLTTEWTVACWFGNTSPSQTQGNHHAFCVQGATGWASGLSMHTYFFNNQLEVSWCKDGFNAESYAGGAFSLGGPMTQWVWTRRGTVHTLYRDGGSPVVLTTTGTATAAQALTGPVTLLGRFDATYTTVENGVWGDCAAAYVYRRALSPAEVRALYLAPFSMF